MLSSFLSSLYRPPPPPFASPDHEVTAGWGWGKLLMLTLTKTTEDPALPTALTPLLPHSLTLTPSARLALKVVFAVTVPICLGYLLSSSESDSFSQRPSCSRRSSHVGSRIPCNGTCPPPAPGARLAQTAAFYAAVPGRLGSGQAFHVQAKVVNNKT